MRGFSNEPGTDAINGDDRPDSEGSKLGRGEGATVHAVSETHPYFRDAARRLLGVGTDAGFQLHVFTGFHERSCYRYAAGERDPPGYFLFTLLDSPQGGPWLDSILANCQQEWWLELKRDRAYAAKVRKAIGELRE